MILMKSGDTAERPFWILLFSPTQLCTLLSNSKKLICTFANSAERPYLRWCTMCWEEYVFESSEQSRDLLAPYIKDIAQWLSLNPYLSYSLFLSNLCQSLLVLATIQDSETHLVQYRWRHTALFAIRHSAINWPYMVYNGAHFNTHLFIWMTSRDRTWQLGEWIEQ